MSFSFTEADRSFRYEEAGSASLRIVAAIAGLLAITFSYVFVDIALSMGDLSTNAKVGGLIASMLSILAYWAFGGYCLKLALFMPRHVVVLDSRTRRLVYMTHSPASGQRRTTHALAAISSIDVIERQSDDSPTTCTIMIAIGTGTRIEMGVFGERVQAEAMIARIRAAIARNRA